MKKYERDMGLTFKCKRCGQVFNREQHECFHIAYKPWWFWVSEKLLQKWGKKIEVYSYFTFCPECSRTVEAKENPVVRIYIPYEEGDDE